MAITQQLHRIKSDAALDQLLQYLADVLDNIVAEAITIQQIPAPTFHELVRANHVLSRLGAVGLADTGIDGVYNAYGRLPGKDPSRPAVLVSAHTDTVFEAGTDLSIRRDEENGRIYGPGLGDNSLGVAGVIALADILRQFEVQPQADIWFVATSREEGLGDLGGIRAFYESQGQRLGAGIIIEGTAFGRVYTAAIPSRRLRVRVYAEGGHSWQHFGRPSAIHELVKICADLIAITPPQDPRTTYNIGLISGGQSINSIASEAGFYLDMRSEDPQALAALEAQVRQVIEDGRGDGIRLEIELVGDRPSGRIDTRHDFVQAAEAALSTVGMDASYVTGSTDGSYLLAQNLPAVTIGLATGDNAHRLDEYIEPARLYDGMKQLILLTLAAAGWEPDDN